jgi:peptidoglycan/xylan/chitin deacetylase (PgdA/CDA1 family)
VAGVQPASSPAATTTIPGEPSSSFGTGGQVTTVAAGPRVNIPTLTYHSVSPSAGSRGFSEYEITTQRFDAQLRLLKAQGWHTITARDLAVLLITLDPPKEKTFLITLDDGWQDGLTDALPAIRRYGFVATYYIVPGFVGTPGYLSWDGVRTLRDASMEIGNHSMSHLHMSELTPDQAAFEVTAAQRAFDDQLGQRPVTFAYPYGSFNDVAIRAVRDAGLLAAFTTQAPGPAETWALRLTLPRIHVHPTATPEQLVRVLLSVH